MTRQQAQDLIILLENSNTELWKRLSPRKTEDGSFDSTPPDPLEAADLAKQIRENVQEIQKLHALKDELPPDSEQDEEVTDPEENDDCSADPEPRKKRPYKRRSKEEIEADNARPKRKYTKRK